MINKELKVGDRIAVYRLGHGRKWKSTFIAKEHHYNTWVWAFLLDVDAENLTNNRLYDRLLYFPADLVNEEWIIKHRLIKKMRPKFKIDEIVHIKGKDYDGVICNILENPFHFSQKYVVNFKDKTGHFYAKQLEKRK